MKQPIMQLIKIVNKKKSLEIGWCGMNQMKAPSHICHMYP